MDDYPYLFETVYYRRAEALIKDKWREGYEVAQMTRGEGAMLIILFQRRIEMSYA